MRKPTLLCRLDGIFGALSRGHRRHHKGIKPARRGTFAFEPLEDRRLLSLCIWTGASDNNMNNAANWNQLPVSGDDIKIPAGSNTTINNNFSNGMQFDSIEIGNNAQITGNPIALANGIKVDPGASVEITLNNNNGFENPITLNAASGVNTIEVDAGSSLNLNCAVVAVIPPGQNVTGTLTKTGAGILGLTTDDQFAGVTIETGALQVLPGSGQCANFGNIDNEGTLIYNSGATWFGGTITGWGGNYAIPLPVEPGGVTSSEVSDAGVRYGSGDNIVSFTTPDLTATYNVQSAAVDLGAGYGWQLDGEPYLVQQIDGTVTVVLSQQEAYTFGLAGGNYVPEIGVQQSLTHNTNNHTFTFETTDGRTCVFDDFSYSGPGAGQLEQQDYNGIRMSAVFWVDSNGYIREAASGGGKIEGVFYYQEGYSAPYQGRAYSYYGSGPDDGRLSGVITYDWTPDSVTPVSQTTFTYYDVYMSDGYPLEGQPGDLTYAISQNYDATTNAWVADQVFGFTYYTQAAAHELKMAYTPQGTYDLGNVVWWNSDSQIEPYSSVYYQYNGDRAVSWAEIAGKYDETYGYNGDVTTVCDTSTYYWDSVCTNELGQVTFSTLYQYSGTTTNTCNVYGSDTYDDGELLESFTSAAITSFYWSSGTPVITFNTTGLVNVYSYYSSGDQEGMLYQVGVQNGYNGTPIWTTYYGYTASLDSWDNGMVLSYVSNPEVAYSYYTSASYSGGLAVTDYPAVSEGSSADAVSDVWYCGENPVWSMDAMGKFTYNEYDDTGALVETIQDISGSMAASLSLTPPVTLPSTGLNATTDYAYDSQGRSIQVLGPARNVNGTSERAATWMVYDPDLESGWDAEQGSENPNPNAATVLAANGYVTQDGSGNWTVATVDDPVSITTYGSQGQVTNAITASYSGSLANFLAADATTFAQSSFLTWTSYDYNTSYWALSGSIGSHLNSGKGYCLLVDSKTYFDIPASGVGTTANYDETTYGYDSAGRLNYEEDPNGAVTTMSLDAFGNVLDIDKGTTSGTALVSAYTYNSDGLMTTDTEYTAGYGSGRVTTYEYNWQDELEYTINPLDSDGRRTYTAYTYDDLGNVTEVQTYWAYDPNVVPGPNDSPGANDKLTSDVAYAYDAREQLYQTTTYAIDPTNFGRADASPEYTYYWYDQAGDLIKTESSDSDAFTKYTYDDLGQLTGTYTGYNDSATTYADFADSYGNVNFTGDTILEQTQYTYDAEGNVIMTADFERDYGATGTGALTASDARVTYVADWYDSQDRVIAEANYGALSSAPTRPDSPPASSDTVLVTQQTYNDAGLVSTVTDPAGNEYAATYDNANRITSPQTLYNGNQIEFGGNAPSNTYSNGQLATQTDAYGNTTQYCYDSWGRLGEVVAPYGSGVGTSPTTYYSYDSQGELTSETDPMGHTTTYEYDNFGRQIDVTYPAPGGDIQPQSLTTDYDVRGNVASQTDQSSHTTSYTYDQWNHLSSETDPDGDTTYYSYNVRGELLSVGNSTTTLETYTYDDLGRMTSATDSDNNTEYYEYDGGLLWRTISRDGKVEEYAYDNFGRVIDEYWYDSVADANIDPNHADPTNVIYYTYDRLGDVLTEGDNSSEYTFTYDALGRVASETQTLAGLAPTVTFTSSYADLVGPQRTSLLTAIGSTDDSITNYTYDGLGNLTSISQQAPGSGDTPAEKLVKFTYNNDCQVSTMTRYADVAATQLVAESSYTYNGAGELTSILHFQGSTQLQYWAMAYDAGGNLTARSSTTDDDTTYSYDAAGQLTDETSSGSTGYTYDADGNRTSQGGNSSYTYNSENQLTFDGTYTYTYDADGNCTSKYVANNSGNTDITVYSWDNRDRLTSVTHYATAADQGNGAYDYQVNYTYDVLNQLIKRDALTPNSGTTESVDYFIYESGQVVLQFHEDNPTGNLTAGDLVHRYLWNPQQVDQLLADEQVSSLSSAGQVVWPLLNDQNSVTDLATYEEGITAVAAHRVYGAYGNTASSSGSVDCAFGYTGKYSDPLTGLQFNTDRWYNAATGRWMSKDPLGLAAGPNVYRYAGNNPSNCTDPSGLTVYTTNASAGELSGGNPISIQGAGGSYNDLVYRPGETPVSIDIGPFRPGDYGGPVASLLDYSSSDLVYHPGETPVSIGVGPFRPGDYPGQQTWSLASDEVAPPPGFHRQVFPDGTSAWIPDGAIVQYFEDGTYRIMYPNGQAVNTGKPDPNAQGFWSLWGRNIVKPWQMEDRGFRIAQYTVLIVTAASAIAAGGFAAAGYSPWLGAIQLHGAHHGLAAHIQILLRTGAHQTSTLGRIPWPW